MTSDQGTKYFHACNTKCPSMASSTLHMSLATASFVRAYKTARPCLQAQFPLNHPQTNNKKLASIISHHETSSLYSGKINSREKKNY